MDYCLGIDTSNYTTSLAAAPFGEGEVVFARRLLSTPAGMTGLRQSDAHFQHTKNLPELARELKERLPDGARITRVAVSTRPRGVEGSYMPCFLAGVSAAHTAALSALCDVFETSHQEGHIAAALYGAPDFPETEKFFSLHLSGGTMELVLVTRREKGFATEIVGKTLDITAGQLIDRIGVLMGLAFPCGRELDALACAFEKRYRRVRIPTDGCDINLSGFENKLSVLAKSDVSREEVAHTLFCIVASAIEILYENAKSDLPLILCGGVSASSFLRAALKEKGIFFTAPALATDNAVGVALLGREAQNFA